MPKFIHPIAGTVTLLTIVTFWASTLISELFMPKTAIITVKTLIPWGFFILIPALVTAGATGFRLARGSKNPLIKAKQNRMPIIAGNGILLLIPTAIFLANKAQNGEFDHIFYAVQAIELIAGFINIILLSLNMRDGLHLKRKPIKK